VEIARMFLMKNLILPGAKKQWEKTRISQRITRSGQSVKLEDNGGTTFFILTVGVKMHKELMKREQGIRQRSVSTS